MRAKEEKIIAFSLKNDLNLLCETFFYGAKFYSWTRKTKYEVLFMIWTVELAAALDDAPFPATREELIEWAERNGLPQQVLDNLYELEEIQEGEDMVYEGIEDIWPDYIRKEDFFHNEEDEGFDYDDV